MAHFHVAYQGEDHEISRLRTVYFTQAEADDAVDALNDAKAAGLIAEGVLFRVLPANAGPEGDEPRDKADSGIFDGTNEAS